MTDTPNNPWTLDEFVEQLNQSAPLPSEDGRRASAWTPRLVRHYASLKTLSAPERRGRQAYYGEQHLREAQQLTSLQQAGVPSKTAALLMESQNSALLAEADEAAFEANEALNAQTASASFGLAEGFAGFAMTPGLGGSLSEPAEDAGETPWLRTQKIDPSLMSKARVEAEPMASAQAAPRGLVGSRSALSNMGFAAAASGAPTDLGVSAARSADANPAGPGAQNAQASSSRERALELLGDFQRRGGGSLPMVKKIAPNATPHAAPAAGAAKTSGQTQNWRRWSPMEGVEISLREDQWGAQASLEKAFEEWAKKFGGVS